MKPWNYPEIVDNCISQIETDLMPFHDVFRCIYGMDTTEPSKDQLASTLELISFLFEAKDVVAVFGPEMKPSGNSLEQDLAQIKAQIATQPYSDYHYGIWFDFKKNWDNK